MLNQKRATATILAGALLVFSATCSSGKSPTNGGEGNQNQAPSASLQVSPTSGPAPLQVSLQLTCFDSDGSVSSYELDSTGDGQYDTSQSTAISVQKDYSDDTTVRGRCRDNSGAYSPVQTRTIDVQLPPPPAAPSGLSAVAVSQTGIDLGWTDNADDETAFNVERSPDGSTGWVEIGTVGANASSYSDTGLTNGTSYSYRVRANGIGGFSAYSNIATATAGQLPPAAPAGLVASPVSETRIDLAWVDNADNEESFHIEESPDGVNAWVEIGTVASDLTTYSHSELAVGSTHHYRVRAGAPGGFSDYSNTASATTPVGLPPAPTELVASPVSSTQIDLAWTDNAGNETDFRIERSPDGVSDWAEVGKVAVDVVTYSDKGLDPGTPYFYRVRAHRYGAFSVYTNVANATTMPLPPLAPTGLSASTISKSQIDLSWTDVAFDETAYHIERSLDGTSGWAEIAAVAAEVISYSDEDLQSETSYHYRVRANGPGGFSEYSNTATATTLESLTTDVTFNFLSLYQNQEMRSGTSKIVWFEVDNPAVKDSLTSSVGTVVVTLRKGVKYEIRAEHTESIDDDWDTNYSVLVGPDFKVQRAFHDESSIITPRNDEMEVDVWKLRDGVYDAGGTMDLLRNNFNGLTGTVRFSEDAQPVPAFVYIAPGYFRLTAEQTTWLDELLDEARGLGLHMVYQEGIVAPKQPFFGMLAPDSVFPEPLGGTLFDSLTFEISYSGMVIPLPPVTKEAFKREFWDANFNLQDFGGVHPPILTPEHVLNTEARKAVVAILLFDPKTLFR